MGLSGHENFKDENSLNIPDEIWRPIYDKVWPNLSFVDRVWCMSQQLDKEFMEYLILEYTKDPHLDEQLLKKCHKTLLVALKTKKQTLDPNVNAAIQKSGTDDDVIQDAVIKNVPVPEHSSVYPSAPEARVETLDTVVIERASALIESCASQPVSERAQSSLDMYSIENLTSPASMTHLFETAVNNADPLAAAAGDVLVNALPEVALKEAYLGTATALDQLSDSKLEPATVEILREIGEFKLGSKTIEEDLFSAITRLENTPVTEEVTHAICHVKLADTLPMSLNKLRHLANLDDPRTPKGSFTEIALNLIDVSDGIDTNPHLIATLEQINSPKEDEIAAFSELYENVYVGSPSPVPIAHTESSETTDINRASKLIEQYAMQPVSEKAQHSLDKYDVKELTSTASMTGIFETAVNKAVPLASAAGDVLEYALPEVALKKAFSDIAVALNQLNDSDMDSQTIEILREIGKLDLQSKTLEQHLLSALARLEQTPVPQTLMQALQHVMIALTLPLSLNKLRHLAGLVDPRVPQELNQSFGEIALALIAESDKIAQNPKALLALSHFTYSEDNDIEALLELYQDAPALVQDKLGDCSKKVLDAVLNSTTQDVPEQPSQSAEHPVSTVAIIEEQGQQPQQPAIGTDSDIEKPPKKEEDIGELLKKADLNSLNAVVTRRFMHILKDIDSQSFEKIQRRITKERVAFEEAIEKVREYKISSRNRIAFKGCLALFDSSIVALKSLEMIKPDEIKSHHVAKEHDDKARNKALTERRGFVSGVYAKAFEKVARTHNPQQADIDSTKAAANFLDNFDRLNKNIRLFFGKASKFLTKTTAQANQFEPQTKKFVQGVLGETSPKISPRARKSSDEDIIRLSPADVAKLSPADVEENIARFSINQVRSLTIGQVTKLKSETIINLNPNKIDALYEIAPLTQIQNPQTVNEALKKNKKTIDAIFPKFFKGFHVDNWQDNLHYNTYEILPLYWQLSQTKKEIYQQNSGFFGNLFIRGPLYYLENLRYRLNRWIDKGSNELDDLKPVVPFYKKFIKGLVNFVFWHLQLPFFLLMRIQQVSKNPDMMYLPKIAGEEIKNISISPRVIYKIVLVVILFLPTALLSLLLKGVSLLIPDFLKSSVEVVETPAGDEKGRNYLNDLVYALENEKLNKNIDPEALKKIKSFKDSYPKENFNLEVLKEDVIEIIGFDPQEVIKQYYASKATQSTTKSEPVTPPDNKQFSALTKRQDLPTVTPSKEPPSIIKNKGEEDNTVTRKLGG